MKANFNVKKINEQESTEKPTTEEHKQLTEAEFEEYIRKSGSAGSFMVFRSDNDKKSELGIDEV